jgi:hypothetical protein
MKRATPLAARGGSLLVLLDLASYTAEGVPAAVSRQITCREGPLSSNDSKGRAGTGTGPIGAPTTPLRLSDAGAAFLGGGSFFHYSGPGVIGIMRRPSRLQFVLSQTGWPPNSVPFLIWKHFGWDNSARGENGHGGSSASAPLRESENSGGFTKNSQPRRPESRSSWIRRLRNQMSRPAHIKASSFLKSS